MNKRRTDRSWVAYGHPSHEDVNRRLAERRDPPSQSWIDRPWTPSASVPNVGREFQLNRDPFIRKQVLDEERKAHGENRPSHEGFNRRLAERRDPPPKSWIDRPWTPSASVPNVGRAFQLNRDPFIRKQVLDEERKARGENQSASGGAPWKPPRPAPRPKGLLRNAIDRTTALSAESAKMSLGSRATAFSEGKARKPPPELSQSERAAPGGEWLAAERQAAMTHARLPIRDADIEPARKTRRREREQ